MDARVTGRTELRRLHAPGNQMPAQPARSRIGAGGPYPFPVLRAAPASTGSLRSTAGALLVLPRDRRNPDRDSSRQGIRQAAGRGGDRVLAAGEGKPLARTGRRGTGAERGPAMAARRPALPRSQAAAGKPGVRGAQPARHAYAHGDRAADLRLWVEVVKSSRKGAVDYSTVPELRGVNLEPYRKPPVAVVKINFIEPNRR